MNNKGTVNEEEIRKFFEKKVNESGHTFEDIVESILKQKKFGLFKEVAYFDKDEEKGRSIDFVAHDLIPTSEKFHPKETYFHAQLRLILECKSLPDHGWVFFGEDDPFPYELAEMVSLSKDFEMTPLEYWYKPEINEIPLATRYSEYTFNDGSKDIKSNKKDNNLHESILAITKATRHHMNYIKSLLDEPIKSEYFKRKTSHLIYVLFQSVIVFNGNMYRAKENDGKWNLESINQIKIKKSYLSKNYTEDRGDIHIVTREGLSSYLDLIREKYWKYDDKIIEMQKLYTVYANKLK